jgi:hypothetical protein
MISNIVASAKWWSTGASRGSSWPSRSNRCSSRSIVRMLSLNGYSYRTKGASSWHGLGWGRGWRPGRPIVPQPPRIRPASAPGGPDPAGPEWAHLRRQRVAVMPSLKITASASARRCSPRACCAMTRRTASASSSPSAAITRCTCVSSAVDHQDALDTRRQWLDSASSGTSNTTTRPPAAAAWRCGLGADHRVQDGFQRAWRRGRRTPGSRMRSRSSAPSAPITSAPKAAAQRRHGGAAGVVSAGDGVGVDQVAPQRHQQRATVLLPLPMPPVRPMRRTRRVQAHPSSPARRAARPAARHAAAGQEGAEGHEAAFAQAPLHFIRCRPPRPPTDAIRTMGRMACQPSQAPRAASSLKSP